MPRYLFLIAGCLFAVFSCKSNTATDNELDNPPYNKLTDSIRQEPNNPDLYYRRGALLYSNNLKDEATGDLLTAWKLSPKEEYALSLTTILKQKNRDSAIGFLKEAISKLPNSISLKIGLARGYQQKDQLDTALNLCNSILQQFPNQLDALLLKTDILKAQNKKEDALTILEQAYSFAPADKDISYDLDYDYAALKNPKAILLADKLIKLDSTETVARAYYVKATYYRNTDNLPLAILNYNSAIAHDYNFLDAYLDKGALLFDKKKFQDAENIFNTALKISPTTAEFYFWLAKSQEAEGKKPDAKSNYQRAYGLDKTLTEAKAAADRL